MSPRALFLPQRARTTAPSAVPASAVPTFSPPVPAPVSRQERPEGAAGSELHLVPVWPPVRRQPGAGERDAETKGEPEALGGLCDGFQLHEKNRTGMPDRLKIGIESLSGIAMDDVRVRYGSPEPARLQALAMTRGTEIHLAPGQERHLAHEAWHVVQQKQGRVPATMRLWDVEVNDDPALEREADRFGGKAASWSLHKGTARAVGPGSVAPGQAVQGKIVVANGKYKGTSERPGWRIAATRKVIAEYNQQHGTKYTEDDFSLKELKLDIAHVVAFDTIQDWVLNYLSGPGPAAEGALMKNVTGLMANSTMAEVQEASSAIDHLAKQVKGGDESQIVASANSLLSILNSVPANIRAANKYVNRYLHAHLDPNLTASPGGQHIQADPHTKTLLRLGAATVSDAARTPQATRVVSSNGPAPLASMTPETQGLLSTFSYDQPRPRSANVKKAFKEQNPYMKTSGGAAGGMKPKINLAPPTAAAKASAATTATTAAATSMTAATATTPTTATTVATSATTAPPASPSPAPSQASSTSSVPAPHAPVFPAMPQQQLAVPSSAMPQPQVQATPVMFNLPSYSVFLRQALEQQYQQMLAQLNDPFLAPLQRQVLTAAAWQIYSQIMALR